jgi:hypothetical protein
VAQNPEDILEKKRMMQERSIFFIIGRLQNAENILKNYKEYSRIARYLSYSDRSASIGFIFAAL